MFALFKTVAVRSGFGFAKRFVLHRKAVSEMRHIANVNHRVVYLFNWQIVQACKNSGLRVHRTLYSRSPIFCVPAGRITFCAFSALLTSAG